jgi:hypothetical protein
LKVRILKVKNGYVIEEGYQDMGGSKLLDEMQVAETFEKLCAILKREFKVSSETKGQ